MKNILNSRALVVGTAVAALVTIGGVGGAVAGTLITSSQIQDQTIQSRDIATGGVASSELRDGAVNVRDLSQTTKDFVASFAGEDGADGADGKDGADSAVPGPQGTPGETGAVGPQGASGLADAFYSVAYYNAGDTNAGAIATVACSADPTDTDYVAIAGGAQVTGLEDGANARNTPVSSSFPGRMDWSTNAPKENRLDGWIVQFGGNAGAVSDKAPEKTKIWALCVPGTDIPVVQTFSQK